MQKQSTKVGAALAALAFFVSIAYFPGVINTATALRWALLAVGCPILLIMAGRSMPRPLNGAGLCAVLAMVASLAWGPSFPDCADAAVHLAILATAFCVGAAIDDLAPAWAGLAGGIWISAMVAALQLAGVPLELVHQNAVPAGLFENKNMLAEAALVAAIPLLLARSWLSVGPIAAMLMGGSKAVYAAAAVALACWLWSRNRLAALGVLACVAAAGAYLMLTGSPSGDVRIDIWREALEGLRPMGNGIGSFAVNYPGHEHPHNEFLQAIYEYGALAALPAAILAYLLGASNERERLVLVAILAIGCFSFPLHLPVTAFAAALCAGHLARARALVRRSEHRRRVGHGFADSPAWDANAH